MNVLLVNTSTRGGAAKACIRLQAGLTKLGIQAPILCRDNVEEIQNAHNLELIKKSFLFDFKRRIYNYLIRRRIVRNRRSQLLISAPKRISGLEYFCLPISVYDITASKLYEEADIIHLHWISDFLDWESFFKINKKPVVWTFHDQSPFLGGEHYSERYFGIDEQGIPFTRNYTSIELDFYEKVITYKSKILAKVDKLTIVANSEWTKECALQSNLFNKFNINKILYGFPTDIFYPHDPTFCKYKLGIYSDAIALLFVADNIDTKRKGFDYLEKAIESLPNTYSAIISLIVIGSTEGYSFNNVRLTHFGRIRDEKELAIIYSASDLFIIPSLEEAFGQTTVEAMLCGTPCVGFPTGGIKEIIEDGINGYLCDEISVESLRNTIIKYIDTKNLFNRDLIAKNAKENYSLDKYTNEHIKLYTQIM